MRRRAIASLVLSTLMGAGCREPGVFLDGERVRVVDLHLHPGDWEAIPEATRRFLTDRFPFPFDGDPAALAQGVLSADGIADELDKAGVDRGVLLAVYAPRTVGVATNELVLGQLAEHPDRFYGLASLRVDAWRTDAASELERLESALGEPGMVGVKLAHAHQHFRMDDPSYWGIYEVAGRLGKPVYLHTGTSPFPGTSQDPPYTDPAYLEPAILAHPDTRFVLGHLGFDFVGGGEGTLQTCIDLAVAYPNVFLEPSALGSRSNDPDGSGLRDAYRRMREAGVVDRIIYGSDGPQSPGFVADYLERSVQAMRDVGYSSDEIRSVLAGNFDRVFMTEAP